MPDKKVEVAVTLTRMAMVLLDRAGETRIADRLAEALEAEGHDVPKRLPADETSEHPGAGDHQAHSPGEEKRTLSPRYAGGDR